MENLITRPEKDFFVALRNSFVNVCNGDLPAAIILSILENWTIYKIKNIQQNKIHNEVLKKQGKKPVDVGDVWIYKSNSEFRTDSLGFLSKNSVISGIKTLLDLGFIEKRNNPKIGWDRTLQWKVVPEKINKCICHLPKQEDGGSYLGKAIPKNTSKKLLKDKRSLNNDNSEKDNQTTTKVDPVLGKIDSVNVGKSNLVDIVVDKSDSVDPILGKVDSEIYNQILDNWNSNIKSNQIKGVSAHRGLQSKLKYDMAQYRKTMSISEAIVNCIDQGNTVEDINKAIDNYFRVLSSESFWYDFRYQNIALFLHSEKGVCKFKNDSYINTLKKKEADSVDQYKKLRLSYDPVFFKYNSSNILDTNAQTYCGVGIGICKGRNIVRILDEINSYAECGNLDQSYMKMLEETIVAGLYQKISLDVLRGMLDTHASNRVFHMPKAEIL